MREGEISHEVHEGHEGDSSEEINEGPGFSFDECGHMRLHYGMKKQNNKYPPQKAGARIAVREAKSQFSALVERAAEGEEIIITWHGRPRARMLPVDEPRGRLRVDRRWLENMPITHAAKTVEILVRDDRDNRG